MTRFTASNQSAATLKSSRKDVWAALTDPELLPKLTPYLHRIDVDGDRWTWNVAKVPVLGKSIGTTFTEVMTFEEPHRIGFTHDPERPTRTVASRGSTSSRRRAPAAACRSTSASPSTSRSRGRRGVRSRRR